MNSTTLDKEKLPFDIRVYHGVLSFLARCNSEGLIRTTSKLIFACGLQMLRRVWMLYTFVKWATSRKVPNAVMEGRMIICGGCESAKTINAELYCGLCGCPDWKLSRLRKKNDRKAHNCPLGKHEGSYVTMTIKAKSCKGCGKGKVEKPTSIIRGSVADTLNLSTNITQMPDRMAKAQESIRGNGR